MLFPFAKRIFFFAAVSCLAIIATAQQQTEIVTAQFKTGTVNFSSSEFLPASFVLLSNDGNIIINRNNSTQLRASVKNKKLHGQWQSHYNNNQLLDSGNIIKGIPDGVWKTWYPGGQLRTVRTYDADLFFRVKNDIELNHPKFSRFVITERYKKEGRAVLNVLQTSYSFGSSPKIKSITPLELVELNNKYPSAYHPPFNASLHHGLYINYFENGVAKDSGYYKEGLKEGLWIHRDAQSGTCKGMYKQGIRQKEWKYFTPAGKLALIIFYNNKGEEEWRKQF